MSKETFRLVMVGKVAFAMVYEIIALNHDKVQSIAQALGAC